MDDSIRFWLPSTVSQIRSKNEFLQTRHWAVGQACLQYMQGIFPSQNMDDRLIESNPDAYGRSSPEALTEYFCGQTDLIFKQIQSYWPYEMLNSFGNSRQFIGKKLADNLVTISQLGLSEVCLMGSGMEVSTYNALISSPDGTLYNPGEITESVIYRLAYVANQVKLPLGSFDGAGTWEIERTASTLRQSHMIIDFIAFENHFYGGTQADQINKHKRFYGIGVHGGIGYGYYLEKKVPKVMTVHEAGLSMFNIVTKRGNGVYSKIVLNDAETEWDLTKSHDEVFGQMMLDLGYISQSDIQDITTPTTFENGVKYRRYHLPTVVIGRNPGEAYLKLKNHPDMIGMFDKEILQEIGNWMYNRLDDKTLETNFKGIISNTYARSILMGFQVKIHEDYDSLPSGDKDLWQTPIFDANGKIEFYSCINQWFANLEGVDAISGDPLQMNPILEAAFGSLNNRKLELTSFYQQVLGANYDVYTDYVASQDHSARWYYDRHEYDGYYPLWYAYGYSPFE